MLKKTLLLSTLLFYLFQINAQEWRGMNLGMEIGVLDLSGSGNVGMFLNLEPRRKASENTVIGLRIAATINSLTYKNEDLSQFVINEISSNGVISIVPTIDYYWNDVELRPS